MIVLLLLVMSCIHAQSPVTTVFEEWTSNSGSQNTFQKSKVRTATIGGVVYSYVVGATLNSSGNFDILTERYGPTGNLLWAAQYDGPASGNDVGTDIAITSNGEVYICGTEYESSGDSTNAIVIKYGINGNYRWRNIYNGTGSRNDGYSSLLASGATVVACGATWSYSNMYDMLTRRLDTAGTTVWTTTYDNVSFNDGAVSLASRSGSLFVTGGSQSATTTYKIAVWKINPSTGAITTTTLSSGSAFGIDQVTDIQEDASSNVYVCGGVYNISTGYDYKIFKFDVNLSLLWSQTWDGTGHDDVATGLYVDSLSNVILTGYTTTTSQGKDYATVKYNSSGTQQWAQTFDQAGKNDSATAIVTKGTNIYITGASNNSSNYDYYTIKYDASGTLIWKIAYNSVTSRPDRALAIALDTLDAVIVTGQSGVPGAMEYTTIKYSEIDVTTPVDYNNETEPVSFQFIPNLGQVANDTGALVPSIKYYSCWGSPQELYFKDNSLSYVLTNTDADTTTQDTIQRIDMTYHGTTGSQLKLRSLEEAQGLSSFAYPHCVNGVLDVVSKKRLLITNVWSNIDLHYYGNENGLKYYFVVNPGGNPANIILDYAGQNSLIVNGSGQLVISNYIHDIVQNRPIVYELDASGTITTPAWTPAYSVSGSQISFTLGAYNTAHRLIIEIEQDNSSATATTNPSWSTYYGGSGKDIAYDVTTDVNGDVYVVGETTGGTFPISSGPSYPPAQSTGFGGGTDAFLLRFDDIGQPKNRTFFGGGNTDRGYAVANNPNNPGVVYITGPAGSGFPLTPLTGAYNQTSNGGAFLARFITSGNTFNPDWCTYVSNNGYDIASVAVDASDNVYICGTVFAGTVITGCVPGAGVVVCNPGGGAYYQSVIGGNNSSYSPLFSDAYIAKWDNNGVLKWATLFGGGGDDIASDLAIDNTNGFVYMVGETAPAPTSTPTCAYTFNGPIPLCNPGGGAYYQTSIPGVSAGFIARFTMNGNVTWSTYFGGNNDDVIKNVEVNSSGDVYIAGWTKSNLQGTPTCSVPTNYGFPYCNTSGYSQSWAGGGATPSDNFIARFDKSGIFTWSTWVGGHGFEGSFSFANGEPALAIDYRGYVYLGGSTYSPATTTSALFPVYNNAGINYNQPQNADVANSGVYGTSDAYLMCFDGANTCLWSTYFGGKGKQTSDYLGDLGMGICTQGNYLYLTGQTFSTSYFPLACPSTGTPYCQGATSVTTSNSDAYIAQFDITTFVSTNDPETQQYQFNLYPNPTSDNFTLDFDVQKQTDVQIIVYNDLGQVVYTKRLDRFSGHYQSPIDLSAQATGMYMVTVGFGDGTVAKKLLKQ